MNLVMRVSDKVVALDFGRKIAEGTPAEVQQRSRGRSAPIWGPDGEEPQHDRDPRSAAALRRVSTGATQVLHGLTFAHGAGGITTLLGANGAGKTTTLRAICGMVKTRGQHPLGRAAHRRPRDRRHRPPGRRTRTRRPRHVPGSHRRGEPAPGRLRARATGGSLARTSSGCTATFPAEGAASPAGRHALRRRAADARDRARADAAAAPAAARRAFVRPGAAAGSEIFDILRTINAREGSAFCWSSRTLRWRSTWPTRYSCSRPGASSFPATPTMMRDNDAVRRSYLGY